VNRNFQEIALLQTNTFSFVSNAQAENLGTTNGGGGKCDSGNWAWDLLVDERLGDLWQKVNCGGKANSICRKTRHKRELEQF
jgi:hypothetical protein